MQLLVAGNWKMNGLQSGLDDIAAVAAAVDGESGADALICPPATLLMSAADIASGTPLKIGAQTCHFLPSGAHTGDLSAPMLAEAGATHVIVGHSERRSAYSETDATVASQAAQVREAGLVPIICVGEPLDVREAGDAEAHVTRQLQASVPEAGDGDLIIAYEPIWAIGTGRSAETADIEAMHAAILGDLEARFGGDAKGARVLYGGSVKPGNAHALFATPGVGGALVGGASLKADSFLSIWRAAGGQAGS